MIGTHRLRRSLLVGVATMAFGLCDTGASAAAGARNPNDPSQDAVPARQAEAASSASSDDQITDIIVTAQRREESLQRTPVSVTPISGDTIEARQLNDLTQIAVAAPSLTIGQSNYFSIRGVGSLALSFLLDSSVGTQVDEVSLGVPALMGNGTLDDVAQIEVLNGPQGLLFGRNASAGLVNVRTRRPVIGSFEGRISGELDDRGSSKGGPFGYVVRGTVNIPVTSNSALRFNVNRSEQDPIVGLVARGAGRIDDFHHRTGVRGKYLLEDDGLSIYLIGEYNRERGLPGDVSYRYDANAIVHAGLVSNGIVAGPRNRSYGADGDMFRSIDTGGVTLNTAYDVSPNVTVSNIAAWRAFKRDESTDVDYSTLSIANKFANTDRYSQWSDELRASLRPGGFVDGQVGLYGFFQRQHGVQNVAAALFTPLPAFAGSDLDFVRKGRSLAAYGQFNFHLTSALQLIAGARVTDDHISIRGTQNFGSYVVTVFGPRENIYAQSYDKTKFSYKVGAQYQPRPEIMAYVTYGSGFKGASFNQSPGVLGQNLVVRPETADSLEAGLKTELFNRRLRLNLAAYLENFSNLQVQNFDPTLGTFVIGNAAKARTKGVELSGTAKPFAGFTLDFSATLQDAKFRNYPGAPCYSGQPVPSCATGTFNAGGLPLPNASKFISNISGTYEIPIDSVARGFLQASYYHRSSINYGSNHDPRLGLGPLDLLDLRAGIRLADRLEVSIFCRNCTNQLYPVALYDDNVDSTVSPVQSILQGWGPNSVRTTGVTASFSF